MNDEDAFRKAIEERPDDTGLKLVYADRLEERGDYRAATVRKEAGTPAAPVKRPWPVWEYLQDPIREPLTPGQSLGRVLLRRNLASMFYGALFAWFAKPPISLQDQLLAIGAVIACLAICLGAIAAVSRIVRNQWREARHAFVGGVLNIAIRGASFGLAYLLVARLRSP